MAIMAGLDGSTVRVPGAGVATAIGVACGTGAALCWALGFVAARYGVNVGVSPFILDDDHTWTFDSRDQITSPDILAESVAEATIYKAVDFSKALTAREIKRRKPIPKTRANERKRWRRKPQIPCPAFGVTPQIVLSEV